MADYWSSLSVAIELDTEEQVKKAMELFEQFEDGKFPELYDDPDWTNTGCLAKIPTGEPTTFWLHNNESANLENLATFLAFLVDKLGIDEPIGVEWANGCSKPRLDAYGGGAFVVCRGCETRWLNTNMWMDQTAEEMKAESSVCADVESADAPATNSSPAPESEASPGD